MEEYSKQFVNKYVVNFKKKIVNFNTWFIYIYLIFIYMKEFENPSVEKKTFFTALGLEPCRQRILSDTGLVNLR